MGHTNMPDAVSQVLTTVFIEQLGLTERHIARFREVARIKKVDKKDFLIKAQTVCDFIGIVVAGSLRSFITGADSEFNNDFYFEGSFISAYTSFLTRKGTNCTIEALMDSVVIYITAEQYQLLIAEDKDWYRFGSYVAEHFYIKKCKRETMFLVDSAAVRLEKVLAMYPGLEQRVQQYHIASYIGIKPESLSRVKLSLYK